MAHKSQDLTPEEQFVNLLMKRGKKSVAESIMRNSFKKIEEKAKGKNAHEVFDKAIRNVSPLLEIRARRIGGSNYQIPVEVPQNRRQALAMRWILGAARSRKGADMASKLADELLAASESQGAAFKKKEDTHRMAEANKAFAHFAHFA